jgi:hypothetical protein
MSRADDDRQNSAIRIGEEEQRQWALTFQQL